MSLSTVAGLHFISVLCLPPIYFPYPPPPPAPSLFIYLFPSALSLLLLFLLTVRWATALICPPIFILWTRHRGATPAVGGSSLMICLMSGSNLAGCTIWYVFRHAQHEGSVMGKRLQQRILFGLQGRHTTSVECSYVFWKKTIGPLRVCRKEIIQLLCLFIWELPYFSHVFFLLLFFCNILDEGRPSQCAPGLDDLPIVYLLTARSYLFFYSKQWTLLLQARGIAVPLLQLTIAQLEGEERGQPLTWEWHVLLAQQLSLQPCAAA